MVVSVSLHATNRILFFKVKVLNELLEKIFVEWHFLKTREKAWLSGYWIDANQVSHHVSVVSHVSNSDAGFGIRIQNFFDEIFAVWREELWHLVICAHDFLVEV